MTEQTADCRQPTTVEKEVPCEICCQELDWHLEKLRVKYLVMGWVNSSKKKQGDCKKIGTKASLMK